MIAQMEWATAARVAATSPEQLLELFDRHLRDGDLEALAALYEPEAVFFTASGDRLSGRDEIRAGLADLVALEPTVGVRAVQVLSAGATALVISDWSMGVRELGGSPIRVPGSGAAVVRRQSDGEWLIAIDHP